MPAVAGGSIYSPGSLSHGQNSPGLHNFLSPTDTHALAVACVKGALSPHRESPNVDVNRLEPPFRAVHYTHRTYASACKVKAYATSSQSRCVPAAACVARRTCPTLSAYLKQEPSPRAEQAQGFSESH